MLNYIWGGMILIGIAIAAFTGKIPDITNAAIDSSKEAVTTCITMTGILSMWTGLMKIAEESGLIKILSKKMSKKIQNIKKAKKKRQILSFSNMF